MKKVLVIILLVSLLSGCNFSLLRGNSLAIIPINDRDIADITGNFTLILYGANHSDDLETIAILDKEGDEYEFEPYAPEFAYKTKKHLPAQEALAEAGKFVSWHHSFQDFRLSKLLDKNGSVTGYEVRPLYYPFDFGLSDVLDVDYITKGSKIIVRIRLSKSVEEKTSGDNRKKGFFGIE